MTTERRDIEDGAAWARRVLRKPEPAASERKGTEADHKATEAERIAAWSAKWRGTADTPATLASRAVEATRSQLATPGSAFHVGAERYAADGTRWQRVA